MISEDSDYTSETGYPVMHHPACYDVNYYPSDVTAVYPAAIGYPGHVIRQPAALIGRRFYDDEDDWSRCYDDDPGDLYRSAMAYRCRFGGDAWEFAEPLSYNSRPAHFYPCHRYNTSTVRSLMAR